jgi:hypothetical protein
MHFLILFTPQIHKTVTVSIGPFYTFLNAYPRCFRAYRMRHRTLLVYYYNNNRKTTGSNRPALKEDFVVVRLI